MWFDWGVRLLAILALASIVAGLVVLSLPDAMEGKVIIPVDTTHSVRVADVVGGALVIAGALVTWATLVAWQRKRIGQ